MLMDGDSCCCGGRDETNPRKASYTCLLHLHGSTSRLQNVGAAREQIWAGVSSAHDRGFSQQPTEAVLY